MEWTRRDMCQGRENRRRVLSAVPCARQEIKTAQPGERTPRSPLAVSRTGSGNDRGASLPPSLRRPLHVWSLQEHRGATGRTIWRALSIVSVQDDDLWRGRGRKLGFFVRLAQRGRGRRRAFRIRQRAANTPDRPDSPVARASDLPTYVPAKPKLEVRIPRSIAHSVLCHPSVSRWCKASGYPVAGKEHMERCARLAADTARQTVIVLNEGLSGRLAHPIAADEQVDRCIACHGRESPRKDASAKMTCGSCHSLPADTHPDLPAKPRTQP